MKLINNFVQIKLFIVLFSTILITSCLNAQVLFSDDFNYTSGNLVGQGGWVTIGSSVTTPIQVLNTSLNYSGYVNGSGIGGSVVINSSGEDDQHYFNDSVNSGSIYAAFLVNVTSSPSVTGDYFILLGDGGSVNWYERVQIRSSATNGFDFGILKTSTANSGSIAWSNQQLSFGKTYLIVSEYTFNTGSTADDVVSLFINPDLSGPEPTPTITTTAGNDFPFNFKSVILRQGSPTTSPIVNVDGIRIARKWVDIVGLTNPVIVSPTVASITSTSAILGGNVTSVGGYTLTARGTVYKTSSPVLSTDNPLNEGGITNGIFTHTRLALIPQTLYYFNAFATNINGTSLTNNEGIFRTYSNPPIAQASSLSIGIPTTSSIPIIIGNTATFPVSGATKGGYAVLYAISPVIPVLASTNGSSPSASTGNYFSSPDAILPTSPSTLINVTGLKPSNTYNFLIVPYTWDGINSSTYNYLTSAAPTISGTTPQQTLLITSPVGGENWIIGNNHSITWTSSNVSSVKIEFTTNNGTNWSTVIASTLASAGAYSWTIPSTPSTQCKVRISDTSNASLNCVSVNVFTIVQPSISITSPIGTESLQVGTSQNITWTSNYVTNVKIEYTTDNGGSWSTVIVSTPASSGSFIWTVPNTPSALCKVRISDASNASLNSVSTNPFSIIIPCLGIPTVTYFGKIYHTIQIGNQCWLKENLDVGTSIKGSVGQTNNSIIEKYCYNDDTNNCNIYGGLYQWDEAMQYSATEGAQGICPTGWHIPSNPDYYALETLVPDGNGLKAVGQGGGVGAGTNTSGFTALISGYRNENGTFSYIGTDCYFWSSTLNSPTDAIYGYLDSYEKWFAHGASLKIWGESVRCIKNGTSGSLLLQSPYGGENWHVGTSHNIIWTSSNVANVKIEYSTNTGASWVPVIASIPASGGSYSWAIPNTPSTNCEVRISDTSNSSLNSISAATFTIYQPTLLITTPIGAENWVVGSSQKIKWTSNNVTNVKIEYSTNTGSTWSPVIASIPALAGSYSWTIPNTPSNSCEVRISDTSNSSLNSVSTAPFTISQPTLSITAPNGSENWLTGSSQIIKWTSSNVANVKIEYSINSGSTWSTVIASTPASVGSFSWTVPGTPSTQCKVRLSDTSNASLNSVSTNLFTISLPPTSGWTTAADINSPNYDGAGCAIIYNGTPLLFTIGGHDSLSNASAEINKYNMNTNSWSVCAPMPARRLYTTAAATLGKVYVFGGCSYFGPGLTKTIFVYDIASDSWTTNNLSLPDNQFGLKAYPYQDSIIYIVGGMSGSSTLDQVLLFNVNTNTIRFATSLPVLREEGALAITDNKIVYIGGISTGGSSENSTLVGTINQTDRSQITWVTKTAYPPGTGFRWNASRWGNNNIIITGGNKGDGTPFPDSYIYNVSNDSWIKIADKPTPISSSFAGSFNLSNNIWNFVVASGYTGSGTTTKTEIYYDNSILNNSVTLTSPIGGENWLAGSSQNIKWTSSNVANVKLEYSTNTGISWSTIIASTPASTGSFSWTIPNTRSNNCEVRISDTSNSALNSVSTSTFTIYQPTISITSPVGGENWLAGSSHNITWTSSNVTSVKLEYSTDAGTTWSPIISSTSASAGSYTWTLPVISSVQCKVKISDTSNTSTYNISANVFTIYQTALSITSPVGGESWLIGSSHNITWTSSNVAKVKIEYTTDNGGNWSTIGSITASAGTYSWTVPNSASTQCLVRISDTSNANLFSTSSNVFSITTVPVPSISIHSPAGGENWLVGTNYNITWTSSYVTGIKIEYTTDNGNTWSIVIASTPAAAGSYSWAIPNTQSTQCKVRLSDTSNASTNSISANVFTIYQPSIALTSPVGGEEWEIASAQNILWTSSYISNVKIEYTTDNGSTWATILNSTASSLGSYSWTVPNAISSNCKVRVSDADSASLNSVSSSAFTIWRYPDQVAVSTNVTFGDQTKSESYKLIGIPGDSTLPVAQVFSGTYKTDWRAFYDNGASSNFIVEYDGSSIFTFQPGNGFWILSKNALAVSKSINSVTIQSDATYSIPLHSGWNIISDPFDQTVSWAKVLTANGLAANNVIYNWNGAWQQPTFMSLYEGYYFNNSTSLTSLKIPYQPKGASGGKIKSNKNISTSTDAAINLRLVDGTTEAGCVTVSFNNNANDKFNDYDYFAPPDNFQSKSITIFNDKLVKSWDRYLIETRKEVGDGQEYDIIVKNSTESGLNLNADGLISIPGYQKYLVDMKYYKFYNLDVESTINVPAKIAGNNYKLLIGTSDFINKEKLLLAPSEYCLYQNYPNPFNPVTTIGYNVITDSHVKISIYNSLGELVKELVNTSQDLGYHEVQLDASRMASGVYFYSLQINSIDGKKDFRQTKKMILLK